MSKLFCEHFRAPQFIDEYLDRFVTSQEQKLVENIREECFTSDRISEVLPELNDIDEFIKSAYERGVISMCDDTRTLYKLGNFYLRLDIMSTVEYDEYIQLPKEIRIMLDSWCMDEYIQTLDINRDGGPTTDAVYTLNETLEYIDAKDDPVFLHYCDCRSLRGDCNLPRRTCLTYKTGVNTYSDRGFVERISKEEAKRVVIEADKAGLMHTVNDHGICNCCGDCCYLFRAADRLGLKGVWPSVSKTAVLDTSRCIVCKRCISRCHFGVFSLELGLLSVNSNACVGCGLCMETCPTKAIHLD